MTELRGEEKVVAATIAATLGLRVEGSVLPGQRHGPHRVGSSIEKKWSRQVATKLRRIEQRRPHDVFATPPAPQDDLGGGQHDDAREDRCQSQALPGLSRCAG